MSVDTLRTTYRVADFLEWQKSGSLSLSPAFQRRSVWNASQKSYLLDTVVRGLPMPIVLVRNSIDMDTFGSKKEMVDGQQRIRTLLGFIDPPCLADFDVGRDEFTLRKVHYPSLAGKSFGELPESVRKSILSYEISTHVLPIDFDDRQILQLFARINSTGMKLNQQELRNASYSGEFKTWSFNLATEQLDRWRDFGIFSEDQISRMKEVETVSDLLVNMAIGLSGKTQSRLDNYYRNHDDLWAPGPLAADRFRHTMDLVTSILENQPKGSPWSSEVNFFTLFVTIYDLLWGLGSKFDKSRPAAMNEKRLAKKALKLGERIRAGDVPEIVVDAMQRASADLGRRKTRFDFVRHELTSDN